MTKSIPSKPVVVTAGEPAGIGPELCLGLAKTAYFDRLLVIADPVTLRARAKLTGSDVQVRE